jgi:hypothetical protein
VSSAEHLFERALALVQSPGIRAWAASERTRAIWIQIAEKYIPRRDAEHWLCVDIVGTAIGLF